MGKKLLIILQKMHYRRYVIANHDDKHKNLTTEQRFRLRYEMYEILDLINKYKERLKNK